MELMTTKAARAALPGLLASWRAEPGRPVYIGAYGSPEAVLVPEAVWYRTLSLISDDLPGSDPLERSPTACPEIRDLDRMDVINASEARVALYQLLQTWRIEPGRPIAIWRYSSPGAVLVPLMFWETILELISDRWDEQTAMLREARLQDPDGPQPVDILRLALAAGCDELPMPVSQSRGVPRGGAALEAWPAAMEDLARLASKSSMGAAVTALRAVCLVLLGRASLRESRCGRGTFYTVADVDGVQVVNVTARKASRPTGRRGGGGHDTVELVAVDHLSW